MGGIDVKSRMAMLLLIVMVLSVTAALGETRIVTVNCTGDVLLGSNEKVRREGAGTYSYDTYVENNGYAYPFAGLYDLFSSDDITFVNLECVLADEMKGGFSKSRFIFRAPTDYAKILTAGSVEVANLANNHTENYGTEGMNRTVAALEAEGIGYCGTTFGLNSYWIADLGEIKIGFVGTYPRYNGGDASKKAKRQKELQSCFDACREAGCQVIIAATHCGGEYQPKSASLQWNYENLCIKFGADLVIGNHPHTPQGIKVDKGVTILHSIGNFTFGGNTGVGENLRLPGYVAQFDLYFEDNVYTGHQLTIWPIHISGTYPENNYQPVLVSGADAEEVMKMIQTDTGFTLNPYVEGKGAVQDFVPAPVR